MTSENTDPRSMVDQFNDNIFNIMSRLCLVVNFTVKITEQELIICRGYGGGTIYTVVKLVELFFIPLEIYSVIK